MTANRKHPITLLQELEQRGRDAASGLPQQIDLQDAWSGIGFRLGDINLIAPLKQVNEILHYPKLTVMPGTQPWVKGVANIRGTLLPIMDLQGFLGQDSTTVNARSRVLVVKRGELSVGLLVSEVIGLKHFQDDEKVTAVTKFHESLRNYVHGAFVQNGVEMLVFSMYSLTDNPHFYQVAV